MARPKTNHEERKRQIMAAALEVFAEHGYEGTTNKLIAQHMQNLYGGSFSPALIYHYFPEGKAQLFSAVIEASHPLQTLANSIPQQIELPLEQVLRAAMYGFIATMKEPETLQFLRIMLGEGRHNPEIGRQMVLHVAPVLVLPLANYLMHQMQQGRLRQVNPVAGIWLLLGPLLARAFVANGLGDTPTPLPFPSDDEMVDIGIQTFLDGLAIR